MDFVQLSFFRGTREISSEAHSVKKNEGAKVEGGGKDATQGGKSEKQSDLDSSFLLVSLLPLTSLFRPSSARGAQLNDSTASYLLTRFFGETSSLGQVRSRDDLDSFQPAEVNAFLPPLPLPSLASMLSET